MEVYSNTTLSQETIIIPNKHSNLMSKATRDRRANKDQGSRRNEIRKIRAEISEMEMKKKLQRSIKLKADVLRR